MRLVNFGLLGSSRDSLRGAAWLLSARPREQILPPLGMIT